VDKKEVEVLKRAREARCASSGNRRAFLRPARNRKQGYAAGRLAAILGVDLRRGRHVPRETACERALKPAFPPEVNDGAG